MSESSSFLNFSYELYYTAYTQCFTATASSYSAGYCTLSYVDVRYAIGGAVVILGLGLFSFPAYWIALAASCRLRRVALYGALHTQTCCPPSLPAAVGLAWTGFIVEIIGASFLYYAYVLDSVSMTSMTTSFMTVRIKPSGGAGLLAVSLITNFIATLLLSSVSCCCAGAIPGVGKSHTNCCCVERDASYANPEHAPAATTGAPMPQPQVLIIRQAASV
jgi:hypothetical protein